MEFIGSTSSTVGIEFELQLLDAQTLDLMNGIMPLLQLFPDRADVKPEMIQSCVEVSSSVSQDTVQAGKCMHSTLADLLQRCGSLGMKLCGAGTHPFGTRLALFTPSPRFLQMKKAYGILGRNQLTFATHVHVGVPSGDVAIFVMRHLAPALPILLAVSANSPFWRGCDTGFSSYRQCILAAAQSYGLPPYFEDWRSFVQFCETATRAEVFESVKDIHWDLRPRPDFGTLELRILDAGSSLAAATSFAALWRSLVVHLTEHAFEDLPGWPVRPLPHWIERANRYRASLNGLSARYIVSEEGHSRAIGDVLADLVDLVRPTAERIGESAGVARLERSLVDGVGYELQRTIFEQSRDCRSVVEFLVDTLQQDVAEADEARSQA